MTVYEIPNINNCTIEEIGNPVLGYRITANNGWYIHINNGNEETENIYKGAVVLLATFDFSTVQIIPESELPEDAKILGGGNDTVTE